METPDSKNCKARLVIIESFFGGSHKQLVDLLFDQFSAVKFVLPAKKWHWRARTSALYFSQTIPQCEAFQVLFTSSVLNLAELVALRPDLGRLKKVLYFHENQLVYPVRKQQERDFQYGYNQILSCLVADIVLFNSTYNLESFLNNIQSFMKLIPDHRPKGLSDRIRPKCQVLYYPLSFASLDKNQTKYSESNQLHTCDNMIKCKKYGVEKKNNSVGDTETSDIPISVLKKEGKNGVSVRESGSLVGLSKEYQDKNITAKRARQESDNEPKMDELSSRTLGTMERGKDSVSESSAQSHSEECVVMETCDRTRNLVEGGDLDCKVPMHSHSGESVVMVSQNRTAVLVEGEELHCEVSMQSHPETSVIMETSDRTVGIMARGDLNCEGVMQRRPEGSVFKETEILGDSEVGRPLHIVWAHRWEHDKDPDTFFQTLFRLHDDGVPFRLSVMGETYSEEPEIFEKARNRLKEHIITWGFQQNKGDYSRILRSADVAVSTAVHEFFGVSMLEAVYCGCYVLCPERLVYPEIFPASCLYRTPTQLYKRLRAFCRHPHLARNHEPQVDLDRFSWETLQEKYKRILCVDEIKK